MQAEGKAEKPFEIRSPRGNGRDRTEKGPIQMLQADPLRERIVSLFDGMSPQLRQAARYIIEHPQEVALV